MKLTKSSSNFSTSSRVSENHRIYNANVWIHRWTSRRFFDSSQVKIEASSHQVFFYSWKIKIYETNKCNTNNRLINLIIVKRTNQHIFVKESIWKWDGQCEHWKRRSSFAKPFFYFKLDLLCGNNCSFWLYFLVTFQIRNKSASA